MKMKGDLLLKVKSIKNINDILDLPLARANFRKSIDYLANEDRSAGDSPRRGAFVSKKYKRQTVSQLRHRYIKEVIQPTINDFKAEGNDAVAQLEFEQAYKRVSYSPASADALRTNVYGLAEEMEPVPTGLWDEPTDVLINELKTDGLQLASLRLDPLDMVVASFKAGRKAGAPFVAKWGDVWEEDDLGLMYKHLAGLTTKEIAVKLINEDPTLQWRPFSGDHLLILIGARIQPGGMINKKDPYEIDLSQFTDDQLAMCKYRAITMPDAMFNIGVGRYSDAMTRALAKLEQFAAWTDVFMSLVPKLIDQWGVAKAHNWLCLSMDYGSFDQTIQSELLMASAKVFKAFFQSDAHELIDKTMEYLAKEKWILTPDFDKELPPEMTYVLSCIAKIMSGVKSTSSVGTICNRIISTKLDLHFGQYAKKRNDKLYNFQLGDDTVWWFTIELFENYDGQDDFLDMLEKLLASWGLKVNKYKQWKYFDTMHFLQILIYQDSVTSEFRSHYPMARLMLETQERFSAGTTPDSLIGQIQQLSLTYANKYGHDRGCRYLLTSDDLLLGLVQTYEENYEQVIINAIGGVDAFIASLDEFDKGSGGQRERAKSGIFPIWQASPMLIEQARSLAPTNLSEGEIMRMFKDRSSEIAAQVSAGAGEDLNFEGD